MNLALKFPAYMDQQAMPNETAKILQFPERPPWFVLRVMAHQERMLVEALREKGVEAYAPKHVTWAKRARRADAKRTRALMPGYLFVCLPDDNAIDTARSMHGVIEIMCRDGVPRRVPPLAIGCLIFMEACFAFDETWEPPKIRGRRYAYRWKAGDRVKVNGGPFAGFMADVQRGQGRDRMQVLLTLFGRPTEVVVEHHQLTKPDEEQNG